MGFFISLVGLALVSVSWFNLLELEQPLRLVLFILGFDMMGYWSKIVIFGLDYLFFETLGDLSWFMLLLIAVDVLTDVFFFKHLKKFGKPLIVFLLMYTSGFDLDASLIVAFLDFLMNRSK